MVLTDLEGGQCQFGPIAKYHEHAMGEFTMKLQHLNKNTTTHVVHLLEYQILVIWSFSSILALTFAYHLVLVYCDCSSYSIISFRTKVYKEFQILSLGNIAIVESSNIF